MASKRRYGNLLYPGFRQSWFGLTNLHHVLNLFEAHRHEHRSRPMLTDRYRQWLAKREGTA